MANKIGVPTDLTNERTSRPFFDKLARAAGHIDPNGGADFESLTVGGVDVLLDSDLASQSEAEVGTNNTKVMTPLRVKQSIDYRRRLLHVRESQAANTEGGTFTASGAYITRTLNETPTNEIGGSPLSSNQITLPANTYEVQIRVPGYNCGRHKTRLYNVTAGSTQIVGSTSVSASFDQTDSIIRGKFTIASQSVFEVQHRCATTSATSGFGLAANLGEVEIYTDVMIWAVA
jgi:hypothetical protein